GGLVWRTEKTRTQGVGCAFIERRLLQGIPQGFLGGQHALAVRAGRQVLLKVRRAHGVQFAIEVAMQLKLAMFTRHGVPPSVAAGRVRRGVAGGPGPSWTSRCRSGAR